MIKNHFQELYARKEQMEKRRISLHKASQELDLSHNTVGGWMRSQSQPITQFDGRTLEKICLWLGCEIGELLSIEFDEEESATNG